ncbi:hypothetical protein [Curtobacterium sp. MCLR17_045]|uniref:hypothetical protein n=1 Tax=Curtobacterium sp. MCLR17_045 TaxID=2175629 RepID=UPI0011B55024|nr:hypothetical protein [Curtobacterium sp. MCLR17_045]
MPPPAPGCVVAPGVGVAVGAVVAAAATTTVVLAGSSRVVDVPSEPTRVMPVTSKSTLPTAVGVSEI